MSVIKVLDPQTVDQIAAGVRVGDPVFGADGREHRRGQKHLFLRSARQGRSSI